MKSCQQVILAHPFQPVIYSSKVKQHLPLPPVNMTFIYLVEGPNLTKLNLK